MNTNQDIEIEKNDIPERLQVKLAGRFDPTPEELQTEAEWIFRNMTFFRTLESSEEEIKSAEKMIVNKIVQTLRYFRCEYRDIPFIT